MGYSRLIETVCRFHTFCGANFGTVKRHVSDKHLESKRSLLVTITDTSPICRDNKGLLVITLTETDIKFPLLEVVGKPDDSFSRRISGQAVLELCLLRFQ